MAGIDELISIISGANAENAAAQSGIKNQQATIATSNAEMAQNAILSAMEVARTKTSGDYAAQEAGIAERNALGNNPQDPDSLVSILTQDFVNNTLQARQQRESVAAKKQVGLFDNPLEFLWNQITLPDEINALNATQSKADAAKQGIAEIQSLTTASAQAQAATKRALTEQSMIAQSQVDAATLQEKVNKLRLDSLGYSSDAIGILQKANAEQLDAYMKKYQIQQQAEHLRLARESAYRETVKFDYAIADIKEREAAEDRLAQEATIGAASFQLPGMSFGDIKQRLKTGTPAEKARIEMLAKKGRYLTSQIAMGVAPDQVNTAVGHTPGEAIANSIDVDGMNSPLYKPTRDKLEEAMRKVAADYLAAHPNAKNDATTRKALIDQTDDYLLGKQDKNGKRLEKTGWLYQQASNVETEGNIFKAPDLPDLVKIPAVQKSTLFEKVLAPAAAAGVKSSNVETILAQAYAARERGEVTTEQIAYGMSELYKAANAAKYASSMAKFSMPYYSTYIAKVPSAFSISGSSQDQVDFADPAKVLSYLTVLEAKKRLDNIGVRQ